MDEDAREMGWMNDARQLACFVSYLRFHFTIILTEPFES